METPARSCNPFRLADPASAPWFTVEPRPTLYRRFHATIYRRYAGTRDSVGETVDTCAKVWRSEFPFNAPAIRDAAFSPIINAVAFVLPAMCRGKIEMSATQSPSTPRTARSGATTERSSAPIRQVPAGGEQGAGRGRQK